MPNSAEKREAAGLFPVVVALFATAAMCVQNAGSGLVFGWALIHGAGPAAVIAFLPLGIGLGTLWGAFWYLSRSNERYRWRFFTALAVTIVIGYEIVLPATPLAAWKSEHAMKAAAVQNVRDEPLLSAKGNPIGIRVTYEVLFAQAVVATVELGVRPIQEQVMPYTQLMDFGRSRPTIDPEPSIKDLYKMFERNRLYKFTVTSKPNFLHYDEKAQQPCLDLYPDLNSHISEEEIVAMIQKRDRGKYRISISAGSDEVAVLVDKGSYLTSREYDLQAMYQTIVTEGHQQCNFPSYERWRY